MCARPVPRWNWKKPQIKPVVLTPQQRDDIVKAIENVRGSPCTPKQRAALLDDVTRALGHFQSQMAFLKGPSLGQVRAALGIVKKDAEKLLRDLRVLDDISFAVLLNHDGKIACRRRGQDALSRDERLVGLMGLLPDVPGEIDAVLAELKTMRRAKSPDWKTLRRRSFSYLFYPWEEGGNRLFHFVRELADTFSHFTRQEPRCHQLRCTAIYKGNFFPFANVCAAVVGANKRASFGEFVRLGLSDWRKYG